MPFSIFYNLIASSATDVLVFVACRVRIRNVSLDIGNAYIQPYAAVSSAVLSAILDKAAAPDIILGDFHARHTVWRSSFCYTCGRLLEQMNDKYNFCVLNDGSATYACADSSTPVAWTFHCALRIF